MAIHPDLIHALEDIDAATNDVAQEVDDLRSQISVGMTPEDVAAVHDALHAKADRLRSIAADPEVPVPPAPDPEA